MTLSRVFRGEGSGLETFGTDGCLGRFDTLRLGSCLLCGNITPSTICILLAFRMGNRSARRSGAERGGLRTYWKPLIRLTWTVQCTRVSLIDCDSGTAVVRTEGLRSVWVT